MAEEKDETLVEKKEEGKPLFYDIWGWKYNRFALLFIVIVILGMISLKMCDSKYIVQQGPETIKIIP